MWRVYEYHWFVWSKGGGIRLSKRSCREFRVSINEIHDQLAYLLDKAWLGQSIRVKVDEANLRAGPGTEHELLGKVTMNTQLIAIDQRNDWYQVINPGDLSYSWIATWLTETGQDNSHWQIFDSGRCILGSTHIYIHCARIFSIECNRLKWGSCHGRKKGYGGSQTSW